MNYPLPFFFWILSCAISYEFASVRPSVYPSVWAAICSYFFSPITHFSGNPFFSFSIYYLWTQRTVTNCVPWLTVDWFNLCLTFWHGSAGTKQTVIPPMLVDGYNHHCWRLDLLAPILLDTHLLTSDKWRAELA